MTITEADHEHKWGPVEIAWITGNPHRKCQISGCHFITLDLHDDELTNWTVDYEIRSSIDAGAAVVHHGQVTVYACEDTVDAAAIEEVHDTVSYADPRIDPFVTITGYYRHDPEEDE